MERKQEAITAGGQIPEELVIGAEHMEGAGAEAAQAERYKTLGVRLGEELHAQGPGKVDLSVIYPLM